MTIQNLEDSIMFTLPKQPQSIGVVLDSGFRLFAAGFSKVIGLSVAANIIVYLPMLIFMPFLMSNTQPPPEAFTGGFFIAALVAGILSMAFYLAIIRVFGAIARDEPVSIGAALTAGLKRLLPMLIAAILYMIVVSLGMVLLIIPGMIVMLTLMFFSVAMVLDEEGIISSLSRSHKLVWGNWWRTATVLTVPLVIVFVMMMAVSLLMAFLGQFLPAAGVVSLVMQIVVNALTQLLFYAIFVVQYQDLILRKEGTDLELRLQQAPATG